jgi:hypothetical protein
MSRPSRAGHKQHADEARAACFAAGVASFTDNLAVLNPHPHPADTPFMTSPVLFVPYFALWAALMRALLVKAGVLAATCARCGLRFERQHLGETICSCSR